VAKVLIPPPYRGPTQGAGELEVEGQCVRDCLLEVERRFPGFLPLVVVANGAQHRFVKIFRNGDQLTGDALQQSAAPEDEIEIVSAIAGG